MTTDPIPALRSIYFKVGEKDAVAITDVIALIECLQRDIAALMSDNAEQVRIASEAVRALIGLRNRCRVQGYALRRVIEHVELRNPFDTACLDAVKRVCAELEGRGEQL